MDFRRRLILTWFTAVVSCYVGVNNSSVFSQTFTYVGPNNGSWQTAAFWAPFNPLDPPPLQPPPRDGDVAIILGDRDVFLSADVQNLAGLAVGTAADLLTNGHQLEVANGAGNAEANIIGTGTTGNNTELFVQPAGIGFIADILNLNNGAELDLVNNSTVHINRRLNVDALSIITGEGTIVFTDTHNVTGRRFDLQGTLEPTANSTISLVAETGTIDLDGMVHNDNLVDLTNSGSSLVVDGPLTDSFTGSIHMGSGATLNMMDAWIFGPQPGDDPGPATIQFTAGGGTATISGADVTFGGAGSSDATINALTGTGRVTADAVIQSNASISVSAGAALDFDGQLTYTGAASITGAGQFDPGTLNRVIGDVTIATDIINFDGITTGGSITEEADWDIRAHLTLNAETIDDNGSNIYGGFFPAGDPTIEITTTVAGGFLIEDGRLTVNLPGTDQWTLADNATMNINGPTTASRTHVAGSRLVVEGRINVDGHSRFTAPIDVETTGQIQFVDADASLELASDSLMSGGTIAGDGTLISNGAIVSGHGTIHADIDFSGSSELWADNGTLRITGNLADLGVSIGTSDDDGVLLIEDGNWDTSIVGEVRLNGGSWIDGAALSFVQHTAAAQIRGHGTINVESINNYGVIAAEGGTLEIVDRLDWDGGDTGVFGNEGDGTLAANAGNLLLSNPMHQGPSFVGTIETAGSHTFTYDTGGSSDEILFDDATGDGDGGSSVGRLQMNGGALIADIVTHRGQFSIQGARSTIIASEILFDDLSHSTIESQLRLDTSSGIAALIEPNAKFDGDGGLANTAGSVLVVQDQAEIGVDLINEGSLFVGAGAFLSAIPAEFEAEGFQQANSGDLRIDIAGTDLDEFDRINVLGGAALNGRLTVELLQDFVPSLGDMFEIMIAGGTGVSGTFATRTFPIFDDLTFNVIYNAQNVVLQVVELLPGDYNNDGVVDAADYTVWRNNLGAPAGTLPNDIDGGLIGPAQYATWKTNFGNALAGIGSGGSASSNIGVPEPASALLLLEALTIFAGSRRRRLGL